MKVITPITVTDAMLTSSTVAEPSASETAWSASAVYGAGDKAVLTTSASTVTISNGSPAIVTWTANNIGLGAQIVFTTTGTLPAGLVAGAVYYLLGRIGLNQFTVSATLYGAPIATSSAGSGTHTATAYIHRAYQALIGASGTVTMTIAAAAVVSWAGHGRSLNDAIVFTTTGALPTGVVAGTTYYIISAGLTADQFQFSQSLAGTAVTTSGSQSGVHTCGLALTYNKPPMLNISTVWADVGSTNKMAMFDLYKNIATAEGSPMTVVITPGQRVDSLALIGVLAQSVTVTVSSVSGGGTVYTNTQALVSRTVSNWYEYYYKPFLYKTAVALFDIPPFADAVITVTFTTGSGSVQCTDLVLGLQTDIGTVQLDAVSDVLNFSTVTRDAYGVATMVPRRNVNKTVQTIWLDRALVDGVRALRDSINGVPAVYSGIDDSTNDGYGALLIKGFYRKFSIALNGPIHANISLELEAI